MTSPNPEAWGVQRVYEAGGERVTASEAGVRAALEAMGAEGEAPPSAGPVFVRRGRARRIPGAVEIATEDGDVVRTPGGRVPPDLPLGYHRLDRREGPPSRLVVAPLRAAGPSAHRAWGWAVQLYALRSDRSWGIGDLADLSRLMSWSGSLGAALTLINPLHAPAPARPQQASPYSPTSRSRRNLLFLALEDVPGVASGELEDLARAGRALNRDRLIDRDAVFELKMEGLRRLWKRFSGDPEFDDFVARGGDLLRGYASYCALAETYGADWRVWPTEYRRPDAPRVRSFARAHSDRVRYFQWQQWLCERQVAKAARRGGLVQDLAVGSEPGGADAWQWQDVVAPGVRVGAPPDSFNHEGQDWGVLAFDPWKLRAANYEPLIHVLRANMTAGGGLRIDHVMGLWRLFWVPPSGTARDGVYVRYPAAELLDIVSLESRRAGAYVIGEDLGTVEHGVRGEMARRNILSYRLLWFERSGMARLPTLSLAAVTNHDLPTLAGLWSGEDIEAQRSMGFEVDEGERAALIRSIARRARVRQDAPLERVVEAVYRLLAGAPSALIAAPLEDALGVRERPNHPGTTEQWPNWRLALPASLEQIESDPAPRRLARILSGDSLES